MITGGLSVTISIYPNEILKGLTKSEIRKPVRNPNIKLSLVLSKRLDSLKVVIVDFVNFLCKIDTYFMVANSECLYC
jgi:hypothetical protein